jgi:hypothetical protein
MVMEMKVTKNIFELVKLIITSLTEKFSQLAQQHNTKKKITQKGINSVDCIFCATSC